MKKIKGLKVLYLLLALVFAMGCFAGCAEKTKTDTTPELSETLAPAKDNQGNPIMLTENGSSNYKIVIPADAMTAESLAASQLSNFLKQSTGATLPIVQDTGISYDENAYYISVGETTLLEQSNIEVSRDELGAEGLKICNRGRQIFLTGAESDGTLYAAYEFLAKEIGFEVYYIDEIYYRQEAAVPVYAYNDYVSVPDISEGRWVGCGMFKSFAESSLMRFQYGYADGSFNSEGNIWGLWSHSLPYLNITKENYPDHPEWFYGSSQVCFSQMSLADEVARKIIEKIPETPNGKYWQIGDGDSNSSCNCADCQKNRELYGSQGGVLMVFLNRVGELVDEWMTENNIDREILILGLAYEGTSTPPSRYNETTGEYEPINEKVRARSNVGMMYAPITDCTHHSYMDERCYDHQTRIDKMKGWAAVCPDNLSLWLYNTNFRDYFLPFNDWGGIKDDAELYEELGVEYIFSQSCKNGRTSFDALRLYLRSKLWWDSSLDYNTLFDNFFINYYKSASEEMLDYFELIQAHYITLYQSVGGSRAQVGCGNCFDSPQYYGMGNWSYEYLMKAKELLQKAYDAVENSEESESVKEKLRERIRVEEVHIDGYLWNYYSTFYSKDAYEALEDTFMDDCARFGISYWNESTVLTRK